MGLRKILTTADPALHKVCKPVTAFDEKLHKLLDDMRDTLIDSNGVGLAAPQVGILRRIFLVDVGLDGEQIVEFINPEILETDGEQEGAEGCLSVPGRYGLVKRPYWVKVRDRSSGRSVLRPRLQTSCRPDPEHEPSPNRGASPDHSDRAH